MANQSIFAAFERMWQHVTNALSNKANASHTHDYIPNSLKGAANGVAELDSSGKVLSSQLPAYVDDVIEGYLYNSKFYNDSAHTTVITGETGKIYIDLSSGKTYRWGGSSSGYVVISETLALGETSSTAYRGDRGKIAYDHSQAAHAPTNAEKNQNAFSNIKVGSTTVAADTTTDTLELVGSNVTLTPDATNDKVTIGITKANVTAALGYTPPTTDDVNALKYAGSDSSGGAATSAKKLTTSAGSETEPVYFANGVPVKCTSVSDKILSWGTTSTSGAITPLDGAVSAFHSANRLAFAAPAGINIQYSTDGTTFVDYPDVTDAMKTSLVSGIGTKFYIGAKSSGTVTTNDKLRIVLTGSALKLYTRAKRLLLNFSTNGASGCFIQVEGSKYGSETTFTDLGRYTISGWPAWNSIPLKNIAFGGSGASNYAILRFTIGITTLSTSNNRANVTDIALYGTECWTTPSSMAKHGHIYSYDAEGNVTFPGSINADSFIGTADSALKDGAGNTITSYYMKSGSIERIQGTSSSSKDLNSYTTPGFYNIKTQYVSNCPQGIGADAVLLVYAWNTPGFEVQEITETASSSKTRRWIRKNNKSTWGSWVKVTTETTDDLDGGSETWTFCCGNATTVI